MPRTSPTAAAWTALPDEELLDLRICDLGLTLEDGPLAPRLEQLDAELERRGLRFRPYAWLSTEWFTPDDCTGFAIPFYLAHPRLARLERAQMIEVEGGDAGWFMKLLRHETAHAIDNAYGLRRRRRWREVFGPAGAPYDSTYSPDPTSREHVLNLYYWYSQSHPLEDWAETFAVWLRPGWRARYQGWGALSKLEYVDELMTELADQPPRLRTRRREEPVSQVQTTLRAYYQAKQATYADEGTPAFDGQLARLFQAPGAGASRGTAAGFLRKNRRYLVRHVATVSGQHSYLVDHVVQEMIRRCQQLGLRAAGDEAGLLVDAAVLLTLMSTHFLYGAHPRYQR